MTKKFIKKQLDLNRKFSSSSGDRNVEDGLRNQNFNQYTNKQTCQI